MAYEKSRFVIDDTSFPLHDKNAVKFDRTQSLTTAQKQKARENIGAGSADDVAGKLDKANVYNGLDKTAAGYALDARQGKVLNDQINATQSGLAIIVDGDTASMAVLVGGYAYIKNNTHGLVEGLYTNTSSGAFPTSGGTADGTVFTAVSGGALNTIQQSMASIESISITAAANVVIDYNNSCRIGKIGILVVGCHVTANGVSKLFDIVATSDLVTAGATLIIGKGNGQWDVTGVAYGYLGKNAFTTGNVSSGTYLHIYIPIFFE